MEDVLDLYAEPYDPDRPVVCFDETSTQLLADTRPPIPVQSGQPRRQDYEYRRGGTRNIFLTCEPLAGWRHLAITQRRTMQDFAHQMRWLVDEAYPDAPVIRVVLDYICLNGVHQYGRFTSYETWPRCWAALVRKLGTSIVQDGWNGSPHAQSHAAVAMGLANMRSHSEKIRIQRVAQRPALVAFGDEGEEDLRLLDALGQVRPGRRRAGSRSCPACAAGGAGPRRAWRRAVPCNWR